MKDLIKQIYETHDISGFWSEPYTRQGVKNLSGQDI
jgi:hypothetical protein